MTHVTLTLLPNCQLIYLPSIDMVFADKLPMCTEPGCAFTPEGDDRDYRGLVKPGRLLYMLNTINLLQKNYTGACQSSYIYSIRIAATNFM